MHKERGGEAAAKYDKIGWAEMRQRRRRRRPPLTRWRWETRRRAMGRGGTPLASPTKRRGGGNATHSRRLTVTRMHIAKIKGDKDMWKEEEGRHGSGLQSYIGLAAGPGRGGMGGNAQIFPRSSSLVESVPSSSSSSSFQIGRDCDLSSFFLPPPPSSPFVSSEGLRPARRGEDRTHD